MRIDRILNQWPAHFVALAARDTPWIPMAGDIHEEVRRFLADWVARMKPVYMAVSLERHIQFSGRRHSDETLPRGGSSHVS
jgi:hypothetical protein